MKQLYKTSSIVQMSSLHWIQGFINRKASKIFFAMTGKILTVIILCAEAMTSAFAVTEWTTANCSSDQGTIITLGSGTAAQKYCKAKATMNWWSAYSWCQAMGGHMPSVSELCPDLQSITTSAVCNTYPGDVWTSTPYSAKAQWQTWHDRLLQAAEKANYLSVLCLPHNCSN